MRGSLTQKRDQQIGFYVSTCLYKFCNTVKRFQFENFGHEITITTQKTGELKLPNLVSKTGAD